MKNNKNVLEEINFETGIVLNNIPIQWVSSIATFYEYLPQYPVIYIHFLYNNERIYGFPTHYSVKKNKDNTCSIHFNFLCNKEIEKYEGLNQRIEEELSERIGLNNCLTIKDVKEACSDKPEIGEFLEDLWGKFVVPVYGGKLPYGRFYEHVYSIVRFVAALSSMSGQKSEMQMLYDFMRYYGEKINVSGDWKHLEFYLIPTYEELISGCVDSPFNNFYELNEAMLKFSKIYFTKKITFGSNTLKVFEGKISNIEGYDIRNSTGFRKLTNKLLTDKKLSIRDKKNLDFLVDAFNRMPLRAFSFIASIININKDNDFKSWTKKEFVDLYMSKSEDRKMLHPKIWGCFLQQGFGKEDIIPIDNWVESIYSNPLAIKDNYEFLNSFSKLGKLERLFWLVAQARKTNMQIIFNNLWCIKYGTGASTSGESNSKILRGPNPLSCYKCGLRTNCAGYKNIEEKTITLSNSNNLKKMTTDFLVILQDNIPKKVYVNDDDEPFLIDAFTGLELHKEKIELTKKIITVKEFIMKIKV